MAKKSKTNMLISRTLERVTAVVSFVTAVALAFLSLLISEDHEIASGNLMGCAQFLLFTASVFGLDYKLGGLGSTSPNNETAA